MAVQVGCVHNIQVYGVFFLGEDVVFFIFFLFFFCFVIRMIVL